LQEIAETCADVAAAAEKSYVKVFSRSFSAVTIPSPLV